MDIVLPKSGLTVLEGEIGDWRHAVGDRVRAGDVLVEIQADKVDLEVEAPGDGVLTAILVESGGIAPVGAVLAQLTLDSEETAGSPSEAPVAPPADEGRVGTGDAHGTPDRSAPSDGAHVPAPGVTARRFSSPRARRRASELGVDVRSVVGTGPSGRVVARDVEDAAPRSAGPPTHEALSVTAASTSHSAAPAELPRAQQQVTTTGRSVTRLSVLLPVSRAERGSDAVARQTRWLAAVVASARRVGLVEVPPGGLVCDVLSGADLDLVRRVDQVDDLNVEGIASRLAGPPRRPDADDAHIALVDLHDCHVVDGELGWLPDATVTVSVGAPVATVIEHDTAVEVVLALGWAVTCTVTVPPSVDPRTAVRFTRELTSTRSTQALPATAARR